MPPTDAPTPGYRRKRARTRRALVRGAMDVLGRSGGAPLTTAAVCVAAGVSHGTLYNYVSGLDELGDVVADELASVFAFGAETLAQLDDDPVGRIALGVLQLLATPTVDAVYARAFLVAMASRPDFRRRVRGIVGRQIACAVEAGSVDVPTVDVATDAIIGTTLQALRSALDGDPHHAPQDVLVLCLRLLGVPAADHGAITARAVALTTTPGSAAS